MSEPFSSGSNVNLGAYPTGTQGLAWPYEIPMTVGPQSSDGSYLTAFSNPPMHPDYRRFIDQWVRCRDFCDGQDAVQRKRETYLPRLPGHNPNTVTGQQGYTRYLAGSWLYGAAERTVDALTGMAFRRPPRVVLPPAFENDGWDDDITGQGVTLNDFGEKVIDELERTGRVGVLTDYSEAPDENATPLTLRKFRELGLRPFLTMYRAEEIYDWSQERVGGQWVTTRIVLHEFVEVKGQNVLDNRTNERLRILELDQEGYYRQLIYEKRVQKPPTRLTWRSMLFWPWMFRGSGEVWDLIDGPRYPLMNGQKLEEIPFDIMNAQDLTWDVVAPPIVALVNANAAWYRNCADYEWGLTWCGNPTPVIIGELAGEGDDDEIPLGGSEVLHLVANPGTSATFLEFKGTGLKEITAAMDRKEDIMAILGARMLAPEKRVTETAETANIHRHGENSALAALVNAGSRGILKSLQRMCDWASIKYDDDTLTFAINTKFVPPSLDPQMLMSILQAAQKGYLARPDIHAILQDAELIDEDRTWEEVKEDFEADSAGQLGMFGRPDVIKALALGQPIGQPTNTPPAGPGSGPGLPGPAPGGPAGSGQQPAAKKAA